MEPTWRGLRMLTDPATFAILLLAVGWLLGRRPVGRWLTGLVTLVLVALVFVPVGDLLVRPLENRFHRPELPDRLDGIIVLGGMFDRIVAADRGEVSTNDAVERLAVLLPLARRYPEAPILFTGGRRGERAPDTTEAVLARRWLEEAGLPTAMVFFEDQSRDTFDNAVASRAMALPHEGQTWLLVTSAFHMPRSVGTFRQAGWPEMLPYPVDFRTERQQQWQFAPNPLGQANMAWLGLHEWLGLAVYRMLGRTDALLPAPAEKVIRTASAP
jgi:uncharacterized SAM-binding protein YcdF (DUF218 family)